MNTIMGAHGGFCKGGRNKGIFLNLKSELPRREQAPPLTHYCGHL